MANAEGETKICHQTWLDERLRLKRFMKNELPHSVTVLTGYPRSRSGPGSLETMMSSAGIFLTPNGFGVAI
jgi:hypothetical protein